MMKMTMKVTIRHEDFLSRTCDWNSKTRSIIQREQKKENKKNTTVRKSHQKKVNEVRSPAWIHGRWLHLLHNNLVALIQSRTGEWWGLGIFITTGSWWWWWWWWWRGGCMKNLRPQPCSRFTAPPICGLLEVKKQDASKNHTHKKKKTPHLHFSSVFKWRLEGLWTWRRGCDVREAAGCVVGFFFLVASRRTFPSQQRAQSARWSYFS